MPVKELLCDYCQMDDGVLVKCEHGVVCDICGGCYDCNALVELSEWNTRLRDALMLPLLFHAGGPVTTEMRDQWKGITGSDEMTTRVMCESIRVLLAADQIPDDALDAMEESDAD